MKIENEKIIQATEDELYSYWLSRGWDDIYSFPEYMQRMRDTGCEVIAEIPPKTLFDRITASPEVLAPRFMFFRYSHWRSSLLPGMKFRKYSEAIAATVARLKEVENG